MVVKDGKILDVLREHIQNAKKSILISSAWIKREALEKIFENIDLERIADKRIVIRTGELSDLEIDGPESIDFLRDLGFEIAFHPNLHAKFVVIDNRIAIIGSANLTPSGLLGVNKEIGFLVQRNREKIKDIVEFFESVWEEALKVPKDLIGITMNPGKSGSIEFLVLSEDVSENEFVVVENEDGREILCRIETMMIYDTSFFMNPFTTTEAGKFPSFEDFSFINAIDSVDWKFATLNAFMKISVGSKVAIATAKVVGEIAKVGSNYILKSVFKPIPPKLWVRKPNKEVLENLETPSAGRKVRIGTFYNLDIGYHLDFDEITSTHMAVLGTTGSGKSYFVKLLISRTVEEFEDALVYVIDPHGEYAKTLSRYTETTIFEIPKDVMLLTDHEDVQNILKKVGNFGSGDTGMLNKLVAEYFFDEKNTDEIIREFEKLELIPYTKENSQTKVEEVSEIEKPIIFIKKLLYPLSVKILESYRIRIQNSFKKMMEILSESENVKLAIFDFSKIDKPELRVSAAGFVMDYLFKKAKERDGMRKIIVLEEAHNFVPEKSTGDVSSGKKSNPAFRSAHKIASEGRKFNIVLFTITQRPANVSKYILSQANTLVVFRLVNEMDLKAIGESAESVSKDIIKILPSLRKGEAFVFGLGSPIPALVKIDSDLAP